MLDATGIPDCGPFTPFSKVRGKSEGNWNRYMKFATTDLLNESAGSAYRMTAVCDLIPESLDGADLEQ